MEHIEYIKYQRMGVYSRFRVGDACGLGFFCLSVFRTVVGSFFGEVGAGGFRVSVSCAEVLLIFLFPLFLSC